MSLDSDSKKWLSALFGSCVRFDEPMSGYTSLRVGGPADAMVVPDTFEKLFSLVAWCDQEGFSRLIVGEGTNLLVKDGGINAIVIVLTGCLNMISIKTVETDAVTVSAMAGVKLKALCSFALSTGLEGMNFAIGIPGTLGGAIIMNAGTPHGSMADILLSITVMKPDGKVHVIERENLVFDYRKTSWGQSENRTSQKQSIILEGRLCLHPSDPEKLKKEAREIMKRRGKKQPLGVRSAGCFFKNPPSGPSAGQLIERAGLKGSRIGGAEISQKHANFIINTGNASASDILALGKLVQEKVSTRFNINLENEVQIVGAQQEQR